MQDNRRAIVWLRRVWFFFRDKYDQRNHPRAGELLRAADEVVWSCYNQVFESAELLGAALKQGPPPLPFVEARYSPAAYPPQFIPGDLQAEIDKYFKAQFLAQMPVPVVRLTPACVESPWWLIFVGHEVGHQIQHTVLPEKGLVKGYSDLIETTVQKQSSSDDIAKLWAGWSEEVFADIFSVLVMGPQALRGILELELAGRDALTDFREPTYPPAAVRLALLAETVRVAMELADVPRLPSVDLAAIRTATRPWCPTWMRCPKS